MNKPTLSIDAKKLSEIMTMVYNIALGMLHNEHDAEDASQEILEIVCKKVEMFRGESKLETWVYRIAHNHLLRFKKRYFKEEPTFEDFEEDINNTPEKESIPGLTRSEEKIYIEEIKTGCTKATLQCLSPENRFIFILGSLFCFSSPHAAEICGISEEAYRQRFSRIHKKMRNFMKGNCGLINKDAKCKCKRRISTAIQKGRIDPTRKKSSDLCIKDYVKQMNELDEISQLFRTNPWFDKSEKFRHQLKEQYSLFGVE